ncbi:MULTISPECIES: inositol monophosphatase family protein [unclassified Leptolyngbya]|uniref:inositol monophosphatase family protein n=1 Tax=unclassified Leptolyngbya TaxID=2650499 RepID=UPI001684E05E|nr:MULTISPECIES: inositol monophosphatase family protein [unclassified Leptolyngbya]MBD1913322.1 inositol monophosphatase family protein [Leptolyngbya sp. FACHB-8]MBD2155331.1 inositol monophosphatase family protein [Leptolyngbya sp. FACHB-16]
MNSPTPRQILEALFPYLKVAASYAKQIQPFIRDRPAKDGFDSTFGAALSDADLSIQTLVEVALLGTFPNIRFYGEEYEQTYNTKYFRAITLGPQDDYLVTLDPIDGTRYYLDGHPNYQILLGILNRDEFAGAIALTPALNTFTYALQGEGIWEGSLDEGLEQAQPLQVMTYKPTLLLGLGMTHLAAILPHHYQVLCTETDYSKDVNIPNVNGILSGELTGVVIRAGKFIDGALLAFMAQELGCIVTTHDGEVPPPLHTCTDYGRPGLVIAASAEVHQELLTAIRTSRKN